MMRGVEQGGADQFTVVGETLGGFFARVETVGGELIEEFGEGRA